MVEASFSSEHRSANEDEWTPFNYLKTLRAALSVLTSNLYGKNKTFCFVNGIVNVIKRDQTSPAY